VAAAELDRFRQEVGLDLPKEYQEFLQRWNGGEGLIGAGAYVQFWPLGELAQHNRSYQANECYPGYFIFGSDGGGEAFAFDTRTSPMRIVMFPFIGMEPDVVDVMAATFTEFLEVLANLYDRDD
jgi:hypothetical protein